MNTFNAKPEEVKHKWYVVDATNQKLGRLAAKVAMHLRGKNKPTYTPNVDVGDYIIIVNADKIIATGNKPQDKKYYWHTGYPGGIKERTFEQLLEQNAAKVILLAVKGMLPKNKLSRAILEKLKIYTGSEHPHSAQQPEQLV